MTQNAHASPLSTQGRRRRKQPDLSFGVFSDGRGWKVYSSAGSPDLYPSREEALFAAETRAFAAAQAGRQVELFVEAEDGSLAQSSIDLAGVGLQ
jgi:hypothetical protein